MSAENAPSTDEQDAMAAEWAAALAETKPETASEVHADQVSPASFQNFTPTTGRRPATTST